jgi:Fe-S cluster assembly iron-binding protein IscA
MAITLTPAAVDAIRKVRREHDLGRDHGLRVSLRRGRGGAREVSLDVEEGPAPTDRSWPVDDVVVFCDARTHLLLGDARVDYGPEGFAVTRLV